MKLITKTQLGLTVTIAAAIVFGLYPACMQLAYRDGANSTFVVLFSTLARALLLAIFAALRGHSLLPTGTQARAYISGGFFQAVSIGGILASLQYIPGPVTIVILFTHTLLLLFYLAIVGERKLTPASLISASLALLGISLVVDIWSTSTTSLSGVGISLAALASVATASRLYVFGRQVVDTNPALVGARIFTVTFLFTLMLLFIEVPAAPDSTTGLLFFLLGSASLVLGTFGMFYGIWLLGSFKFSLFVKFEPIFTALFSFLLLGEALRPIQYIGIGVVVVSLVGYQLYEKTSSLK